MKLRTKYILFVVLIHLIALTGSYFLFRSNLVLFIIAEVVILVSIVLCWQMYRQLIAPLQLLVHGTEAIRDKDFNIKFTLTGKYEMDKLISVYNQMMDELRMERTNQQQQHWFLEQLIEMSPTGIIILDYDERIERANPRALQILHSDIRELKNIPLADAGHPILKEIDQLQLGESTTITYNNALTYKLHKSHFIDRGFARQFILIEELTAELLAAEKKAYGKVIRMMAHEVNNTIGPVNSILHSTLQSSPLSEKKGTLLLNALQIAIDRNQHLNEFMRNFADMVRLPEPVKTTVDLNSMLKNVAKLMELKAGEKQITFHYNLDSTPFFIQADEHQFEQVLINAIKNAIESIEEEGNIRFTTDARQRKLVIADSGKGISGEVAKQLFSPFFSSKKNGQGIGLTLIREVVHNHGFELSLRTVAPRQTEFEVRF